MIVFYAGTVALPPFVILPTPTFVCSNTGIVPCFLFTLTPPIRYMCVIPLLSIPYCIPNLPPHRRNKRFTCGHSKTTQTGQSIFSPASPVLVLKKEKKKDNCFVGHRARNSHIPPEAPNLS